MDMIGFCICKSIKALFNLYQDTCICIFYTFLMCFVIVYHLYIVLLVKFCISAKAVSFLIIYFSI